MIRRPPKSTLFPTRRSSDLEIGQARAATPLEQTRVTGVAKAEHHARLWHEHARRLLVGLHDGEAAYVAREGRRGLDQRQDRKSTRLNSSHANISYAVFCLKK